MHQYKHIDQEYKFHSNISEHNFSPTASNQIRKDDVTYIRIKGGWYYLAVVLDLFARH